MRVSLCAESMVMQGRDRGTSDRVNSEPQDDAYGPRVQAIFRRGACGPCSLSPYGVQCSLNGDERPFRWIVRFSEVPGAFVPIDAVLTTDVLAVRKRLGSEGKRAMARFFAF